MKNATSLSSYEIKLGSFYWLFQLFVLPLLASTVNTYLLHWPDWGLQFTIFVLNFLSTVVIFHRFLLGCWDTACDAPGKTFASAGLGLLIYYGGTIAFSTLILTLRPDYVNLNNGSVVSLARDGRQLMFLAIVLLAPVAEELLFRGLLFRGLYDRSPVLAWTCSVLCFAAVHVVGFIGQYDLLLFILATVQYFPAGIALCYAYKHSGTIFAPMLMHIIINLLAYLAM